MKKVENRKTSIQKVLKHILWTSFIMGVFGILISTIYNFNNTELKGIEIELFGLTDSRHLISKKEIRTKVLNFIDKDIKLIELEELDLLGIESILNKDARLKNNEVYIGANKKLYVLSEMRVPIIRIMAQNGQDYYLDEEGLVIKAMKNKAVRVPVVTGYIDKYKKNWQKTPKHNLNAVMSMGRQIQKDDFLLALCEQIYFGKDGTITMIPKLGKQLVIGTTEDLDIKLRNIKGAYRKVLSAKDWEKLEKFNFSITNQYVIES